MSKRGGEAQLPFLGLTVVLSSPLGVSRNPSPFVIPACLWQVLSILLPSSPQFVAGIHPKRIQDGFPIKNVGNDGAGERFPLHNVGNDEVARFPSVVGWIHKKHDNRELRGGTRVHGDKKLSWPAHPAFIFHSGAWQSFPPRCLHRRQRILAAQ